MSVRDLAAAWAQANLRRPGVQKNFLLHLEDALRRSVNCYFTIGCDLHKSGRPLLVCCFHGEFFAFELTPHQTARLKVADNMLQCARSLGLHDHGTKPAPTVWLEQVEVDRAESLDRTLPITGKLRYRTEQPLFEPVAIRIVCEPPCQHNLTYYHHLFSLLP